MILTMKRINIIVIVLLSVIAVYLLYRLFAEKWAKIDNILLITLLAGGMINSFFMLKRKRS